MSDVGFYYETLQNCVVCGPMRSTPDSYEAQWECDEPAIYRLKEDDEDWGGEFYVCEKHFLEAYKRYHGTMPPWYVDKDARIAELEAQLATKDEDAASLQMLVEDDGEVAIQDDPDLEAITVWGYHDRYICKGDTVQEAIHAIAAARAAGLGEVAK